MVGTPEGPHLFFDTTEASGEKTCSPKLGRIAGPRLGVAASNINAAIYVPELVVEELVRQRLRYFNDKLEKLESLKPYLTIGVAPERHLLLERFRIETRKEFEALSVTIIPTSATLDEVVALALEQMGPLKGKRMAGFLDIIIFLSSLAYAKEKGLRDCWFITKDQGFDEETVRDLARQREVTFTLLGGVDEAISLMENLAASRIASLQAELARSTLDFMNANLGVVQKYLESHPLKPADFPSHGVRTVQVISLTANRIDRALPDGQPREGSDWDLSFYAQVSGLIRMESPFWPGTPYWPGPSIGGTGFGPSRIIPSTGEIFLGETARMGNYFNDTTTVGVVGKAKARFEGGRFVGKPIILSMERYFRS